VAGHSGGTDCGNAPDRIYGWLDTQMSIARYWGGLTYMGHSYYVAPTEKGAPLVRADVLSREAKEAKVAAKAAHWERVAKAGIQGALL
jgi:hypothetical protein